MVTHIQKGYQDNKYNILYWLKIQNMLHKICYTKYAKQNIQKNATKYAKYATKWKNIMCIYRHNSTWVKKL